MPIKIFVTPEDFWWQQIDGNAVQITYPAVSMHALLKSVKRKCNFFICRHQPDVFGARFGTLNGPDHGNSTTSSNGVHLVILRPNL